MPHWPFTTTACQCLASLLPSPYSTVGLCPLQWHTYLCGDPRLRWRSCIVPSPPCWSCDQVQVVFEGDMPVPERSFQAADLQVSAATEAPHVIRVTSGW